MEELTVGSYNKHTDYKNGSLNSKTLSFNKKKDMAKDTYAPASSLVNTLQQLGIIKDILLNIVLDLGSIIDIV